MSRLLAPSLGLVALCLLGFGAWMQAHALVHAFDTGIYLNWMHGFATSGDLSSDIVGERNFLAHHFQPSALLWSPLVALYPKPLALFLLSAGAMAVTSWILWRKFGGKGWWVHLVFWLQPALASRLFYSFVPDILALPALAWLTCRLDEDSKEDAPWWQWGIALGWLGFAKESLWLVAVAFGTAQLAKRRQLSWVWAPLASALIFVSLFFWWMPTNTSLQGYYGLGFYKAPGESILTALLSNVMNVNSIVWIAVCFIFVRSWIFLPLLSAVSFIAFSRAPQVHAYAGHYLLPVLGILWPAILGRFDAIFARIGSAREARVGLYAVALSIGTLLFVNAGIIHQVKRGASHAGLASFAGDARDFVEQVPEDAWLLVNGNLQPLIAERDRVGMVMEFIGNPIKINDRLRSGTYLLMTQDLAGLDCANLNGGGKNLILNRSGFEALCYAIQRKGRKLKSYDSGLVGYVLE